MDLTILNMDKPIESIDPGLRKMMTELNHARPEKHILAQSRKLCCFYCLCVVLFITNNQCKTPLHVSVTYRCSLVSHTGTQEKMKINNRLGAMVSVDTHARIDIVRIFFRKRGNKGIRHCYQHL